jgi:hypothetical protein
MRGFDFARAYRLIWDPSCKLSTVRRAILTVIVRHADQRTHDRLTSRARVGTRRLAECTGLSNRAVVNHTMDRPGKPRLSKDPALPFGLEMVPSKRVSDAPTYRLTLPPEEPRGAEPASALRAEPRSALEPLESRAGAEPASALALNLVPPGAERRSADPTSGVLPPVVPPEGERESTHTTGTGRPLKAAPGPRGRAEPAEQTAEQTRVLDAYAAAFTADRGHPPAHTPTTAKHADDLLAAVGLDRALAIIERTFASASYWRGRDVTLGQLARDPDAFDRNNSPKPSRPRKTNARRTILQRGSWKDTSIPAEDLPPHPSEMT